MLTYANVGWRHRSSGAEDGEGEWEGGACSVGGGSRGATPPRFTAACFSQRMQSRYIDIGIAYIGISYIGIAYIGRGGSSSSSRARDKCEGETGRDTSFSTRDESADESGSVAGCGG